MTREEIQKLKALLVGNYLYYGSQIPDPVLTMYVEDLQDLDLFQIEKAFKNIRANPEIKRAPLPAQIRASVENYDDLDDAREITSKIITAISKFGWCNSQRARDYLGEEGWDIACSYVNWEDLCKSVHESSMTTMIAQIRDLALSKKRNKRKIKKDNDEGSFVKKPYISYMNERPLDELDSSLDITYSEIKSLDVQDILKKMGYPEINIED